MPEACEKTAIILVGSDKPAFLVSVVVFIMRMHYEMQVPQPLFD